MNRYKRERARVRMCPRFVLSPLVRGGYLLSHFRSTIGVTRLNFSVRNGKRWDPRAIATLVFFYRPLSRDSSCDVVKKITDWKRLAFKASKLS